MIYLRYESATPDAHGLHPGVFMLANKLARTGQLTTTDWKWWRTNNDWLDAAYVNPATVDPSLFDKTKNPVVSCWFKEGATHLLDRVPGYLDLLDRYGIGWAERRTSNPGTVLYEDDVQVLTRPAG